MNRRIGYILIFFGLNSSLFHSLGCISFDFGPFGPRSEFLRLNEVLVILRSSRVYCPCIPGAEMLEIHISIGIALVGAPWRVGSRDDE